MPGRREGQRVCGVVVEYLVAIEVTRVRFPADAFLLLVAFVGNTYGNHCGIPEFFCPWLAGPTDGGICSNAPLLEHKDVWDHQAAREVINKWL